jgi:predicted MFS family arabinose efflux permease
MGMAFALLYPSLSLVAIESVSESRRGSALGTFTAFFDIGIGLGAVLTGLAAALGGYPAAFWLGSVCAAGTGFVVARALGRARASAEVTAP